MFKTTGSIDNLILRRVPFRTLMLKLPRQHTEENYFGLIPRCSTSADATQWKRSASDNWTQGSILVFNTVC